MRFFALIMIVLLGSCSGNSRAPSNQNDACAILEQRRGWLGDMQRAEQTWGVPVHVQMATIWKESSFRARAKTARTYFLGSIPTGRRSTAYGYPQALDGTWDWYREQTGKRRAQRDDYADAVDFIGWYMDRSERKLGLAKNDAYSQYLAYHEGHSGYANGSYRGKSWLTGVASEVQAMANRYENQLQYCT
ncbi:MAG: transglycosylase SLT domain-containing protein [Paracoccaceae bacterium]